MKSRTRLEVYKVMKLKTNDGMPNESMNLTCSQLRCSRAGYLHRYMAPKDKVHIGIFESQVRNTSIKWQ